MEVDRKATAICHKLEGYRGEGLPTTKRTLNIQYLYIERKMIFGFINSNLIIIVHNNAVYSCFVCIMFT